MRIKTHPAEVLKLEFMESQNLKVEELAAALKLPVARLTAVLEKQTSIDADLADSLAEYFGTSKEFWLNLQAQHDQSCTDYLLSSSTNAKRLQESLEEVSTPASKETTSVSIDFPNWMIEALNSEANRLGITIQEVIKVWVADRIDKQASC